MSRWRDISGSQPACSMWSRTVLAARVQVTGDDERPLVVLVQPQHTVHPQVAVDQVNAAAPAVRLPHDVQVAGDVHGADELEVGQSGADQAELRSGEGSVQLQRGDAEIAA